MTSIIVAKAVQDFYDTLTFSGKPNRYVDEVFPKDTSGAAQVPPHVLIQTQDEGIVEWMSQLDRLEQVGVTFLVYAAGKNQAKSIAAGLLYNGGNPRDRLGFDDCAALVFPTGYTLNKFERRGPGDVKLDRQRSTAADIEYSVRLDYVVEVMVDGGLA